jgi:hypothetical protein
MLEILLRKPFISFGADDGLPVLSSAFRRRAIDLGGAYGMSESDYENAETIVSSPILVREVLLSFATESLPWMAGEMLSRLVVNALNSFDGAFASGATNQQQAGSAAGTRIGEGMKFIQEVVQALERIEI